MGHKVYFYGLITSLDTRRISTFFRHGRKGDDKLSASDWGVLQEDINVIQCAKVTDKSRKEAASIFNEFDEEFKKNGYQREVGVGEALFENLRYNNGNIPDAIKGLDYLDVNNTIRVQ